MQRTDLWAPWGKGRLGQTGGAAPTGIHRHVDKSSLVGSGWVTREQGSALCDRPEAGRGG